MHSADHLRGSKSDRLKGRKIVLGVTGSIAAVESVKLCREIIRHGAEVHVVMSRDAQTILHPWALEFASGKPVTTEIDGRVQHVSLCGDVPDKADLLLIAPATANTISKMAFGIDDTPVTTFATTALGTGIPVIVVPAMHHTMMAHKIILENISKLEKHGVVFLGPKEEESKAKMPEIDYIVSSVIAAIGKRDLAGRKVLVIAGSTEEPIDDVRVVTNRSSGETGVELARAAHERGADVELLMGRCDTEIPEHLRTIRFTSFNDLAKRLKGRRFDIVLFPAAVSDYSPRRTEGKMPSEESSMKLVMKRNPKLIDTLKAKFVVGFKAQAKISDEKLVDDSMKLIRRAKCGLVVANLVEQVRPGRTRVLLVEPDGTVEELRGTKLQVADKIMDKIVRMV
ncbi:MAG: bifunctional phosphopantothenoylcysteine decarboxylase/phosphopantothenate--cysteine ligase CoaBC [Candidatus Thermoplasmatota archaeon]|nr:bifunctional phosphopantothenoylcysteine decarboxylase/phosphopantothenate--cysteine ligase CoaBC [Candidatus Thermoplasmatota archaeon]